MLATTMIFLNDKLNDTFSMEGSFFAAPVSLQCARMRVVYQISASRTKFNINRIVAAQRIGWMVPASFLQIFTIQ